MVRISCRDEMDQSVFVNIEVPAVQNQLRGQSQYKELFVVLYRWCPSQALQCDSDAEFACAKQSQVK